MKVEDFVLSFQSSYVFQNYHHFDIGSKLLDNFGNNFVENFSRILVKLKSFNLDYFRILISKYAPSDRQIIASFQVDDQTLFYSATFSS